MMEAHNCAPSGSALCECRSLLAHSTVYLRFNWVQVGLFRLNLECLSVGCVHLIRRKASAGGRPAPDDKTAWTETESQENHSGMVKVWLGNRLFWKVEDSEEKRREIVSESEENRAEKHRRRNVGKSREIHRSDLQSGQSLTPHCCRALQNRSFVWN